MPDLYFKQSTILMTVTVSKSPNKLTEVGSSKPSHRQSTEVSNGFCQTSQLEPNLLPDGNNTIKFTSDTT